MPMPRLIPVGEGIPQRIQSVVQSSLGKHSWLTKMTIDCCALFRDSRRKNVPLVFVKGSNAYLQASLWCLASIQHGPSSRQCGCSHVCVQLA